MWFLIYIVILDCDLIFRAIYLGLNYLLHLILKRLNNVKGAHCALLSSQLLHNLVFFKLFMARFRPFSIWQITVLFMWLGTTIKLWCSEALKEIYAYMQHDEINASKRGHKSGIGWKKNLGIICLIIESEKSQKTNIGRNLNSVEKQFSFRRISMTSTACSKVHYASV